MFIGIGIGIRRILFAGPSGPPPVLVFANTQWQINSANTWNNITDTWT